MTPLTSISPFIFYTRLIQLSGRGGAGAYPSGHWARGGGTPWTGRQSITGPHRDKRDKQPHTRSRPSCCEATVLTTRPRAAPLLWHIPSFLFCSNFSKEYLTWISTTLRELKLFPLSCFFRHCLRKDNFNWETAACVFRDLPQRNGWNHWPELLLN